jgi:hypothetical protein
MSIPEWGLIVGAVLSVGLAVGPWMFMVHAKLAVIASKIVDLCETMDRNSAEHRSLWEVASRHASRLDTHDVQITHIAERLRED